MSGKEASNLSVLFNPGHITRLKGKGHMGNLSTLENVVKKEPLRPDRVLCINPPPPVSATW